MSNFVSALSVTTSENWYQYDLILVFVIIIAIVILYVFRKKTPKAEGDMACQNAIKYLNKVIGNLNKSTIRVQLYTAKNKITFASSCYLQYAKDYGLLDLTSSLQALSECVAIIDATLDDYSQTPLEKVKYIASQVIDKLKNSVLREQL
ncbi:MAG: hypothetical protein LBE09_03265 [Christensenellaceae bacterium]|jgi:cytochrome c biogenesis factor|nr:hypothetical protein [Christensenellaceae bacterium]